MLSLPINLRTLRKSRNLTQYQLGLPVKKIIAFEEGSKTPTVSECMVLCSSLDCTLEDLTKELPRRCAPYVPKVGYVFQTDKPWVR